MSIIMGVGSGIFALFILLFVAVAVCYLGSGSRYASQITFCAASVFLLVLILLLASPRGSTAKTSVEWEISGYDETVTHQALLMSSFALATVAAGGFMGTFYHLAPRYAKAIDRQTDTINFKLAGNGVIQ